MTLDPAGSSSVTSRRATKLPKICETRWSAIAGVGASLAVWVWGEDWIMLGAAGCC